MFNILAFFCGLLISPAEAQTCPTRPLGDSSNACASTAFVNQFGTGTTSGAVIPNLPVIGNATSNGFTQGTRSGNTTDYGTVNGTLTNGDCVSIDSNGNLVDAGAACGTIASGTTGQMAGYSTNGSAIVGVNECLNAQLYGANGNGSTDNASVWTALVAAVGNNGCIYFPSGKYKFSTGSAYTFTGAGCLTIRGDGSEVTKLYWPNSAGGLNITAAYSTNCAHIRDLSLTTGVANGGTALNLSASYSNGGGIPPTSDIYNVTTRGDDYTPNTSSTDYWTIGTNISAWSNWTIINLNGYSPWQSPGSSGNGVGLEIGGTGTSAYATVINVLSSSFNFYTYGIALESYWQGVTINQTNFNGEVGNNGIIQAGSASGTLGTLVVSNSEFAYYNGPQISILSATNNMQFTNNLITQAVNSTVGINVSAPFFGFQATNNMFNSVSFGSFPTGWYGIGLNGSAEAGGNASGNFCLGQSGAKLNTCVSLGSGTSSLTATGNSAINLTGSTVGNSGTNNVLGNNTP